MLGDVGGAPEQSGPLSRLRWLPAVLNPWRRERLGLATVE